MRRRAYGRLVIVVLILLAVTAAGAGLARYGGAVPRCPGRQAAVVLDPGHGGADSGAVNDAAGLVERDLVLPIARRAAALLRAGGYGVVLTRDDDATTLGNSERGRMANACGALVYVSIHLNSVDDPAPNYVKTLWGIEAKDRAFAEVMQAALVSTLAPGSDLTDSGVEQFENGGLLRARMAAVLVEPLFLSHPEEATRLATGGRGEQIALAVTRGVEAWLGRSGGTPPRIAGNATGALHAGDPLLGPVHGSAAGMEAVAQARGAQRLPEVRRYIAEVYRLAPIVGLDPAIVVAQSAHETGFWRSAAWVDHLNPAGIGITGDGAASPSWSNGADAARAQIVHLYLYAAGPIPPDHPLAPYVALDPRYQAAVAAGRAGVATMVADLAGRWAADAAYAEGIARAGSDLLSPP